MSADARTDVEFPGAGGVTLRGWLYRPDGDAPAPAVIMAHGFSATRHMGLPAFAEAFAAAGYAVLLYDHRNLGDSAGEPRQEINPWAQARDYRYALTWLAAQPGIDPDRIALWGSSFSGGEVMVVGAVDPRVKAVIANAPFAGLGRTYDDPAAAFEAMRVALDDESGAGPADSTDAPIGPMQVMRPIGSDPQAPAFLPQPEATEWFSTVADPTWQNTFTLKGLGGAHAFDPAVAAPFLAPTPLLVIVASEDEVAPAPVARQTYAIASEPKQLQEIPGHHFVPYSGEQLDQAIAYALAFLKEHL